MKLALRLLIVAAALLLLFAFSDAFVLSWETMAASTESAWFNVLSSFAEGAIAPAFALTAIVLAVANTRLALAGSLVLLAAVVYAAPLAAFYVSIMLYGF
jgi:hypothetical protein